MLIRTVVAPLLGTNCYVLSDAGRCVVVDPGAGLVDDVLRLVEGDGLRAVGVLVTHGHVDHTWSAAELCDRWDVPLHVHADDAYRIEDPIGSLGPLGAQLAEMAGGVHPPRAPARVETFAVGPEGTVPLLEHELPGAITAWHAPGHTQGSTLYLVPTAGGPVALTGDVLFAGSIGRTDLPGGDGAAMARTLARIAALDPRTSVLPGHGPSSTLATELRTNPYLQPSR